MANYYQPEIETMPYEDLRKLQNERFLKQIRHVWDNVPYYRQKMEEKGKDMGLSIRLQREDIFEAMHRV